MRIAIDGEHHRTCKDCGEPSIAREVAVASETNARRVSYETHARCISESDHSAALNRMMAFYSTLLGLIDEFKKLPESSRIVREGKFAGRLVELDLGSERPTACAVRTTIQPYFTVKSFDVETIFPLPARELQGVTLESLLAEAVEKAKPFVEEIGERKLQGL